MNIKHKQLSLLGLLLATSLGANAQGIMGGHVTGNIQLDGQISREDSVIGAANVPEKLLMPTFFTPTVILVQASALRLTKTPCSASIPSIRDRE